MKTNCETNDCFPEIDTKDLELAFKGSDEEMRFRNKLPEFVKLIHGLIKELSLQGQIEYFAVGVPSRGRAEIFRKPQHPWPQKRLCLEIYPERFMCERLLRHELGHEADRRNPAMLYDPSIEARWKGSQAWALELAANISLDARLGDGGLGKDFRKKDFLEQVGKLHIDYFEQIWENPPRTWPEIEDLANRLLQLKSILETDRTSQ